MCHLIRSTASDSSSDKYERLISLSISAASYRVCAHLVLPHKRDYPERLTYGQVSAILKNKPDKIYPDSYTSRRAETDTSTIAVHGELQ